MSGEAEINAYRLKEKIDELSFTREKARHHTSPKDRNYSKFWDEVREIGSLFKELKPLTRQDREELWKRFSSLCDEVKEEQTENYQYRLNLSNKYYYEIKDLISHAVVLDDLLNMPTIDELKNGAELLTRAGKILSDYKHEMLAEHKAICFDEIQRVRACHDKIWEKFRFERDRRRMEFERRVRENLEKNYERYRRATSALERVQANADKLRDEINNAWSDEYASRASGWLSESEDKIKDIERSIQDIEEWIHEDERKLGQR